MNILIVFAHPEEESFNGAMRKQAEHVFMSEGHEVRISDLYQMNFEPRASRADFTHGVDGAEMNYIMEQKKASEQKSFSEDIMTEIEKVRQADLIIFQFPLWWVSVPAILKGWFDRVLAAGFAWDFGKTYDKGLLAGKKAMLSLTTGGTAEMYEPTGINGDIFNILYPIQHGILYFCGVTVLEPFITFAPHKTSHEKRKELLEEYKVLLSNIVVRSTVPFRPHSDHDETGRLKK